MKPGKNEYAALSKADLSAGTLNLQSREVLDSPETGEKLIQLGLVTKEGKLTDDGMQQAEMICKKLEKLRKGVPFENRKTMDNKALIWMGEKWVTGTLRNKDYITNGEILIFAKPWRRMKPVQASGQFRKIALPLIQKALKGPKEEFDLFTPKWWQLFEIGGLEIIGLENKEGVRILVQSAYYDFAVSKFPTIKFIGRKDKKGPLIGKVLKRGTYQNVVCLIQPVIPKV